MPRQYRSVKELSPERVRELFSYDPETGKVFWKARPSPRSAKALVGTEAGTICDGSRVISVDGGDIRAAQVAWIITYGRRSAGKVKCKDGDLLNTRIDNLAESPVTEVFDLNTRDGHLGYHRAWNAAYKARGRELHLKRKFGLTPAEYQAMHDAQGGVCAICQKPETATRRGTRKVLAVDHCHDTGKVRGLLCVECNTGIGKLREDTSILRAAIRYLETNAAFSAAA